MSGFLGARIESVGFRACFGKQLCSAYSGTGDREGESGEHGSDSQIESACHPSVGGFFRSEPAPKPAEVNEEGGAGVNGGHGLRGIAGEIEAALSMGEAEPDRIFGDPCSRCEEGRYDWCYDPKANQGWPCARARGAEILREIGDVLTRSFAEVHGDR